MGINQLANTPWHKERVHRLEGDERRYKGRCKFYEYNGDKCKHYYSKCRGSAHCSAYSSITSEEFKSLQKRNQQSYISKKPCNDISKIIKNKDDDCYWY